MPESLLSRTTPLSAPVAPPCPRAARRCCVQKSAWCNSRCAMRFSSTPLTPRPAKAEARRWFPFARRLRQGGNPTFNQHAVLTQSRLRSNLPTSFLVRLCLRFGVGRRISSSGTSRSQFSVRVCDAGVRATPGDSGELLAAESQQRVRGG